MPSSSRSQQKFIFAKRNEYGTKKNTPEEFKWVWNDEWTKVKESSFRAEIKAWITPQGDYIPFHRFKNHDDMLPLGLRYTDALSQGWIRVYKTEDCINVTCNDFDAKQMKMCLLAFRMNKEMQSLPISIACGNKIIKYKPMFKERVENYLEPYTPFFESSDITVYHGTRYKFDKPKKSKSGIFWTTPDIDIAKAYSKELYYVKNPEYIYTFKIKSSVKILDMRDINSSVIQELISKVNSVLKYRGAYGEFSPDQWVNTVDFGMVEMYPWIIGFLKSKKVSVIYIPDNTSARNIKHMSYGILNTNAIEFVKVEES